MSAPRELRLPQALYAGEAVDEALKRFDAFATFERRTEAEHWVVTVQPNHPGAARLRQLCGELQNFALGLTIRRGGTGQPS
ncbi:MAG: hypothetical protein JKY37_07320 [Nannocystaceae bacterium]|nr:hypothetical protein [Nannocystaceae bacterium]